MKYKSSVYKTFALITQLGISMIVPILMCTLLGRYFQEKFSLPLFIPFLILGILAGGRNVYYLVKDANKDSEDKEDE